MCGFSLKFSSHSVGAAVTFSLMCGVSSATLLFSDSFLEGGNFSQGQYLEGDLAGSTLQNPVLSGFNGNWSNGTTTTGAWNMSNGGMEHPGLQNESGGRVTYQAGVSGARRVFRLLDPVTTGSVFYMTGLMRFSGAVSTSVDGHSFVGVTETDAANDVGYFNPATSSDMEGFGFGFTSHTDGSVDILYRHRMDTDPSPGLQSGSLAMAFDPVVTGVSASTIYLVILKLEKDVVDAGSLTTGNDRVSLWVNPVDTTTEVLAGAPSAVFEDFTLSNVNKLNRLTFASNDFLPAVAFDEIRLATTWEEAIQGPVVVPEPSTFGLVLLGFAALLRRRSC